MVSSALRKSASTMPYFSFSSFMTFSFTRSAPSPSMGSVPRIRFSCSPAMISAAPRFIWSAARWGSRSEIISTGSLSSSPMVTVTVVPSLRQTTPWMARGMQIHWYFLMPP